MSIEDSRLGTDAFLERKGPPSLDFPFHRDNYYMLEAYAPNRGWSEERGEWWYVSPLQHERDVEFVKSWKSRKVRMEGEEKQESSSERTITEGGEGIARV